MLKQIAAAPLLHRQIYARFPVEKDALPDGDAPPVGTLDAGDALQGLALAASRRPQQAQHAAGLKFHVQAKLTEPFITLHVYHDQTSFRRRFRSIRLTVTRTAALIAMLTRTQMKAPYSSFVRHN